MGFLKMLFKPVTLVIGKLFKRGKAEDAEKQLTDEQKGRSPLMNTLIHSPGAALKFLKDKAAAISKGTKSMGSQAPEDVRQQGKQQYNEEAAEKEGIIVKTTQSFKDRLTSGKVRALKSIDEAFRFSGRKSKYDASKTLMQNAGGDNFKATPMQRNKTAAKVNLPTGKVHSAVSRANLTINTPGNADPAGKAVSDAITSTIKSHFEASKQAQAGAAEAIIEAASESNKNITENLQKVLEATQESNANINQNLSEMYGAIQRSSMKSGKQVADGISSSGQMLDDSVSNYIKQSDEASNQSFKALSEQLYDNEVSFADSHKEEMTLLGKTKSGLNQLIEMVNTQRNATLAAGAAVQGLESKIAEVTQAPARWGERLNQLMEGLQEAAGTMLGQLLGYTYLIGGAVISGVQSLSNTLSNVSMSVPTLKKSVSGKSADIPILGLDFRWEKFFPFTSLNKMSDKLVSRTRSLLEKGLEKIGAKDFVPKELMDGVFGTVGNAAKSAGLNSSIDKLKETASGDTFSVKLRNKSFSANIAKLKKLGESDDLETKSHAIGMANIAYNDNILDKFSDVNEDWTSKTDTENKLKVLESTEFKDLHRVKRHYKDKDGKEHTEDLDISTIALHGLDTRADVFAAYLDDNINKYVKENSPHGRNVFRNLLNVFSRLSKSKHPGFFGRFLKALRLVLHRHPQFITDHTYSADHGNIFFDELLRTLQDVGDDKYEFEFLYKEINDHKSVFREFVDNLVTDPEMVSAFLGTLVKEFKDFDFKFANGKLDSEFIAFIKKRYNDILSNKDKMKEVLGESSSAENLDKDIAVTYSFDAGEDKEFNAITELAREVSRANQQEIETRIKSDRHASERNAAQISTDGGAFGAYAANQALEADKKRMGSNWGRVDVWDLRDKWLEFIDEFESNVTKKEPGFEGINLNDFGDLNQLRSDIKDFFADGYAIPDWNTEEGRSICARYYKIRDAVNQVLAKNSLKKAKNWDNTVKKWKSWIKQIDDEITTSIKEFPDKVKDPNWRRDLGYKAKGVVDVLTFNHADTIQNGMERYNPVALGERAGKAVAGAVNNQIFYIQTAPQPTAIPALPTGDTLISPSN